MNKSNGNIHNSALISKLSEQIKDDRSDVSEILEPNYDSEDKGIIKKGNNMLSNEIDFK